MNVLSAIKRTKIQRTELKGIPFSSPVGTVPLGRVVLLVVLQMVCESPLCVAVVPNRCVSCDALQLVS